KLMTHFEAWQKLIAESLYLTLTRCSVFKGQFVSLTACFSGENQCSTFHLIVQPTNVIQSKDDPKDQH
ncbi:hypothetical protein, partial [Paenibacillus mucilaginosus]|uniref:hypothetical protein n=1 Tax=Paenibacillus mucilaginosus TaxID=61624 RepID=UPI003D20F6FB